MMEVGREESISSDLRIAAWVGWALVCGLFGGLVIWSVFAPFEGAVVASGIIAVEGEHQTVQHQTGGIVAEIGVKEGDRVEKGEILVRLDPTEINAELRSTEAQLSTLLAAEARLNAELMEKPELEVRQKLTNLTETAAFQKVLSHQTDMMVARRKLFRTQQHMLVQRIDQYVAQIEGYRRGITARETQLELLADEIARFEQLTKSGNASEVRVLGLRRQYAQIEGEIESLRAEISRAGIAREEAGSERVRQQQDRMATLLTELQNAQTEIESLIERRSALLDRNARLEIRAPRTGRVLALAVHTVGGVVSASEPLMYIVPEEDRLVADVRISPAEIDRVRLGLVAKVRFTAFDQDRTPSIDAELVQLSADTLFDERSGAQYYAARLDIEALLDEEMPIPLVPGMPVEASIRTDTRNVISYLLKPFSDLWAQAFREQ